MNGYPAINNFASFYLNVNSINFYNVPIQTYYIQDPALDFTVNFLSQPVSGGYVFTYSALTTDGSSLPSCITFYPSNKTLHIYSNDVNDVGEYTLVITGKLNTVPSNTNTLYVKVVIVSDITYPSF